GHGAQAPDHIAIGTRPDLEAEQVLFAPRPEGLGSHRQQFEISLGGVEYHAATTEDVLVLEKRSNLKRGVAQQVVVARKAHLRARVIQERRRIGPWRIRNDRNLEKVSGLDELQGHGIGGAEGSGTARPV